MVKYMAGTLEGLEGITCRETGGKKIIPSRILFNNNKKDLKSALFSYELLKKFKFKNLNDILDSIKNVKFPIKGKFRVDCKRDGKHNFISQDVRELVGEFLFDKGNSVKLDDPKTIVLVDIVEDLCFIGVNPLIHNKRDYKVRSSNNSLNSTIAYSLLAVAGYKKNHVLVDPFCSDGSILIEAALLGGEKLYGFGEDIRNARINMKAAKVKIELSQHQIEYLDTLFKEECVDYIISYPPYLSKRKNDDEVVEILKNLFYHAKYVLKKKGRMVLLARSSDVLEDLGKSHNFKMEKNLEFKSGSTNFEILTFAKKLI